MECTVLLASVLLVRKDASIVMVFDVLAFQMMSPGYPVDSVKEQVQVALESSEQGFDACIEPINQSASWLYVVPACVMPPDGLQRVPRLESHAYQ